MTTITSGTFSSPAHSRDNRHSAIAGFKAFWRQFYARAFDPYRPELHYMRGPGPAWRAKHRAVSPAVQSMLVEIRAAKAVRPPAR